MVEPSPRFEEIKIPLPEPLGGVQALSAVLGIPEWWPTGSRVAVAIAHGSASNMDDPLIVDLHRELTERKMLALRFNFPFGEAGKKSGTDNMAVMEKAYRAALSVLGRDANRAPSQLILGGKGAGAQVAAQLGTERLRIDGLFCLGFPLHVQDRKERIQADVLYRITAPMLFIQGTRDRRCDIETLRATLRRVGTSTDLHVVEDADQHFRVPKRSPRTEEEVRREIYETLYEWIESVVGD